MGDEEEKTRQYLMPLLADPVWQKWTRSSLRDLENMLSGEM